MKTLFVNPAWDAAGCSYRLAQAINKYTNWEARHFRAVPTFFAGSDITKENYNKDEFISIIKQSDIIHFCSATYKHNICSINWGFNWDDFLKDKITIFHDYCSFPGHWRDRAQKKDYWNTREKIGCDAIFVSPPQAIYIYKDSVYIPDIVDELSEEFSLPVNRCFDHIILGHFPTGGGNNKNTNELMTALNTVKKKYKIEEIVQQPSKTIPNVEVIKLKRTTNLGFDAIWREYYGMTTIENLALGVPTMCSTCSEFDKIFKEYFQTDECPFEKTKDIQEIVNCITKYANDLPALKARSIQVRNFMVTKWSASNIANDTVKQYEKLLEKKK